MFKEIIKLVVYIYRAFSPFLGTTACCRFQISCSEYTLHLFEREPFHLATMKSIQRILSCHPFH